MFPRLRHLIHTLAYELGNGRAVANARADAEELAATLAAVEAFESSLLVHTAVDVPVAA